MTLNDNNNKKKKLVFHSYFHTIKNQLKCTMINRNS